MSKYSDEQVEQLIDALKTSITALDDWLNTYASELCNEERVKEAYQRIHQYGTIGYIANVQLKNREALYDVNQLEEHFVEVLDKTKGE